MKTTNELQTVNCLKHKISHYDEKENQLYKIDIRLSDDCRNGHNDFAITVSIYRGKIGSESAMISCGACGDTLANKFPELKIFNDLHLSDVNGVPMYAIENGFFHLKNQPEIAQEYIRATDKEFEIIKTSEDEEVFQYHIENLGIVERWKQEALTAIKQLEEWTGHVFQDDSTRLHFKPLTKAKKAEVEKRISEGYYNPSQIQARANAKAAEEKAQLDETIQKANTDYQIQMAVLNSGLPVDNFIYYNHTNELCFNWRNDQYHTMVSEQQLKTFKKTVDYSLLPKGIKIQFAKKQI